MEKKKALAFSLLIFLWVLVDSNGEQDFDVRKHLSTVTRYGVVKDIADNSFVPSNVAEECTAIHLNLVARHGTRAPTKKRMKDLERLATRLEVLLREAEEQDLSLQEVPAWLRGWQSPWKGKVEGGELISKGEVELYDLGVRTREKFPDLFNESYHPDIYTIKASQIPRASASAVAYGLGLFTGTGSLGLGRHRAFSVVSESRASDILLRFHDCCQNYKDFRKSQEPFVDKLKGPILDEITSALFGRYKLNFTRQDTSTLWFLCKQEASLLDITDQACGLFSPFEVAMLEWTDDLEVFILKGYGKSINYRMGVPLLEDVLQSMEQAIRAKEENHAPGSYEKARLRFAHAETVIPFSCLLGLFLEESEFQQLQREQPLQLPPKPPQKRNWRGSVVAPFAGNNMLVLYSCPAFTFSKYFVQVLHNEHPIPLPGCQGSDICSFEMFKERIVAPHLKHGYNELCAVKLDIEESNSATSKFSKLLRWFLSIFSVERDDRRWSHKDEF
ncbi:Histidine acid phosphatase [Parasponia andersonii]|uniref:Multiple inositol polyphosphate phosphatase 1 n=1 Tax=Parasponia andersonii TaxID=3476 RepID=A0A2P5BRL0_PARAD|nr:Histidine acid phosphatase [Parasponia andersonii]